MYFQVTLNNCKRRIRKIFNGFYIDRNEYLEDFPKDPTRIYVDVNKLTPHMKEKFDEKCKGCRNENCEWCKYNSQGCWDDLFNPLPNGIMAYLLSTQYKSLIVRNEVTDNELKPLIDEYKNKTSNLRNNNSELKEQIKELLLSLENESN